MSTFYDADRYQEIENEFELVDLHNRGELSQNEIIAYLSDKYEWINVSILKEVFKTMDWSKENTVTKKQFADKYYERQKKLYHEINSLKYYKNWSQAMQQIFNEEVRGGHPRLYFYTQINEIKLYYNSALIQWMDIKVEYENHLKRVDYNIYEAEHQANYPSFEIWLPAQKDHFFLRFIFIDPKDSNVIYGQSYLNIPIETKMDKKLTSQVEIVKSGKRVGYCSVTTRAEPSMKVVKEELKAIKEKEASYYQIVDDKVKEYEYLQFLWGIRHRYPHKISHLDVGWMLVFRTIMIIALGVLGVIVHVLGRCEPLSIIIAFLILKTREFVLLREQKFVLAFLTLASILFDIIWITIASHDLSQINFIQLWPAQIATYVLVAVKIIYFGYLLVAEKAFTSNQ